MKATKTKAGASNRATQKSTPKMMKGGMGMKKPKMTYGGMAKKKKKPGMMHGGMAKKKSY